MIRWWFLALVAGMVSGCVAGPGTTDSDQWYFGLVHIRNHTEKKLLARTIQAMGMSVGSMPGRQGVLVGLQKSSEVLVEPDSCRLVIIVRELAELDHVRNMLNNIGGDPCIVDQTDNGH